jgi:hypothetical protein
MTAVVHTYSAQLLSEYDPTRTLTLRNKFAAEAKRRFKVLAAKIRQAIVDDDFFGTQVVRLMASKPHGEGATDKVEAFMKWLNGAEAETVLEINPISGAIWTDKYVDQAYKQGIKRARTEMSRAGYDVPPASADGGADAIALQAGHTEQSIFLKASFKEDINNVVTGTNSLVHKVLGGAVLSGRASGLTADQIMNIVNGMIPDVSIPEINERFVNGMRRTVTIGRTGIVKDHHLAMCEEYKTWGVEGVDVVAEWVTAGDGRVCEVCQRKAAGGPYPIRQVITMIPAHYGCRCVALPIRREKK